MLDLFGHCTENTSSGRYTAPGTCRLGYLSNEILSSSKFRAISNLKNRLDLADITLAGSHIQSWTS
jgi:hypothetical protein